MALDIALKQSLHEDFSQQISCDAAYFKERACVHDPTRPSDPAQSIANSLERREICFEPDKKRVGNRDGFEILDNLEKGKEEIGEMQRQLSEIHAKLKDVSVLRKEFEESEKKRKESEKKHEGTKEKLEEMTTELSNLTQKDAKMRLGVLEERRAPPRLNKKKRRRRRRRRRKNNRKSTEPNKDQDIMRARNEVAHGGDVIGDLNAISLAEERRCEHVSDYEAGFEDAYGISVTEARGRVPKCPSYVARILSHRASVLTLFEWRGSKVKERKETIIALTDEVTAEVLKAPKDTLPEILDKEELLGKAKKVDEQYYLEDQAADKEAESLETALEAFGTFGTWVDTE